MICMLGVPENDRCRVPDETCVDVVVLAFGVVLQCWPVVAVSPCNKISISMLSSDSRSSKALAWSLSKFLAKRSLAVIVFNHQTLHFFVDHVRVVSEYLCLRNFLPKNSISCQMPVGPFFTHAPLADHLACKLCGAFNIVAGTGGGRSVNSSAQRPPISSAMVFRKGRDFG